MLLEFDEMSEDDIRPGDLVFILAAPHDGLEQFVSTMNGTHWSHVGIACGDGMVASARCDSGLLVLDDGGGVRLDPLSWYREELGRDVFIGRVGRTGTADAPEDPRFARRREAAAEFGRLLTREPTIRRTRFSFSKTVLTGIARHGGDY